MKRILYLTFYFEPDLCAGSFRNTPLAKELASQLHGKAIVDVITTLPNRYKSFAVDSPEEEKIDNLTIRRINMPGHKSGFIDQMNSFKHYFFQAKKIVKNKQYDLVFASSSRLFTAYTGYVLAKKLKVALYLDIRDIFTDTMNDVIKSRFIKIGLIPVLRFFERRIFRYASHINLISPGFHSYFQQYKTPNYSFFTNGIDDDFILDKNDPGNTIDTDKPIVITYAGNIGEGQGLHKIIPMAALLAGEEYLFRIIGDGGAIGLLKNEIKKLKVKNVLLEKPVKRKKLIEIYKESHFLFIHLNDYKAFEKVLPSKIFEAGAFPRPILAGVKGFARQFILENIDNVIFFEPGNANDLINKLAQYTYHCESRESFIQAYRREEINKSLAASIRSYLSLQNVIALTGAKGVSFPRVRPFKS